MSVNESLQCLPFVKQRQTLTVDQLCEKGSGVLKCQMIKFQAEVTRWLSAESDEEIIRLAIDDAIATTQSTKRAVDY